MSFVDYIVANRHSHRRFADPSSHLKNARRWPGSTLYAVHRLRNSLRDCMNRWHPCIITSLPISDFSIVQEINLRLVGNNRCHAQSSCARHCLLPIEAYGPIIEFSITASGGNERRRNDYRTFAIRRKMPVRRAGNDWSTSIVSFWPQSYQPVVGKRVDSGPLLDQQIKRIGDLNLAVRGDSFFDHFGHAVEKLGRVLNIVDADNRQIGRRIVPVSRPDEQCGRRRSPPLQKLADRQLL